VPDGHLGRLLWLNLSREKHWAWELPPRIAREPLPSGPARGHFISDGDRRTMLTEYYRVRGWDDQGRPLEETLQRLGLSPAVDYDCGRKAARAG